MGRKKKENKPKPNKDKIRIVESDPINSLFFEFFNVLSNHNIFFFRSDTIAMQVQMVLLFSHPFSNQIWIIVRRAFRHRCSAANKKCN